MDTSFLDLEKITREDITEVLEKYFMNYEIDDDGDILVKDPSRIYIETKEDSSVLRFYSFIHYKDYQNKELIPKLINKVNSVSYGTTYLIIKNDTILCEYDIFLFGEINERAIIKTIRKIGEDVLFLRELLLRAKEILEE